MSNDSPGNPSNLKVAVVALMFISTIILLFSAWFNGCSVGPNKNDPPTGATALAPVAGKCDGAADYGTIKDVGCAANEQGKYTQVCTAQGWSDLDNSCRIATLTLKPDCSTVTTFDELAPIISLNCVGCHVGFDQLAKAQSESAEMIRRIQLATDQADHMPAQRASIAQKDIDVFKKWASDGFLAPSDCQANIPLPGNTFVDFAAVEQSMFTDAQRVSLSDQPNIRYLIAPDQVNLGNDAGIATAKLAANKAINSVSSTRLIFPVVAVAKGVWRININDLGISAVDWKFVEDNSQLQFESFTQTGRTLKSLTRTRLPWMNVADFNDTALRNASVYYQLTKAPATLALLEQKLGVNFAGDLANFKALLVGFNGSSLSPAANRLMSRHQSSNGSFWATYDTGAIISSQQNLFKNPLLVEAGGQANLKFAAGEQLYTLPNGMIASFLALANGQRLNQADPAVVHDFTTNPVSPIIKNAISCFRCHSGGFIPAVDQVRAAISGLGLSADDTQRALALFKPQGTVTQLFQQDNARYAQAVAQLGIDPTQPDPISKVSDRFLGDLSLEAIAGLLVLRPEDLKTCINLSADGKQQAGQLLSGGTISHDQFVQVVRLLLRDCRIFQDPLSQ